MKQLSKVLLIVLFAVLVFAMVACTEPVEEPHVHEYTDFIITKEATCTENGEKTLKCECGETGDVVVIPALGHKLVYHAKVGATCTEAGQEAYYECSTCKKLFDSANKEVAKEDLVISALGHVEGAAVQENYVAATCYSTGSYNLVTRCVYCDEVLSTETMTVPVADHKAGAARTENVVDPTCTVAGSYQTVNYCVYCNAEIEGSRKTVAVKALGHDLVKHDAQVATCTSIGWDEYNTCTRCDYTTYKEIAKVEHVGGDAAEENRVEATCVLAGGYDTVVRCTVCNELLSSEHTVIEALGHDLIDVEAQTVSCTQAGWDAYQYCSVCDYTTKVEIPMLNHVAGEEVREKEVAPTCEVKGGYDVVVYCTVCNEELSRQSNEIAALGHKPDSAVVENLVEATCTSLGSYDSVTYCTVCEEVIQRAKVTLKMLPHDLVEVEAKEAACEVVGWNAHKACQNCDYKEGYEEVAALEHVYGDWSVVSDAKCEVAGLKMRVCSICNNEDTEEIAALEHDFGEWVDVVLPDCLKDGSHSHTCKLCAKTVEEVNPALGHDFVLYPYLIPTETTEGHTQYYECSRCALRTGYQVLDIHIHEAADPVIENYVASTCVSEGGYDVVIYCSNHVCKYAEMSRIHQVIPTGGHAYKLFTAKPATCTEIGWEQYEICLNCKQYKDDYYVEYPALGHDIFFNITLAPTCGENGLRYRCCTRCDLSEEQVMLATRLHSKIDENGICGVCHNALYDELAYELNGEEYTVTGLKYDYTTIVFIPATYNGKPVTAMADDIFKNNKTIEEVHIGNNVTIIPTGAFNGCSALAKITIGTGVTEIKATAFSSTSALKEVHYAGTIDQYAQIVFGTSATAGTSTASPFNAGYGSLFINGEKVVNAVITANVNSYAFYRASGIVTLDISSATIGTYAFEYCYDLVQVILRESVTSIGNYSFMYCYCKAEIINLSGLTITTGDTTNAKNGGIYSNAKKLLSAIPETSNVIITEDGNVFYNNDGAYLFMAFIGEGVCVLPEKINGNEYTVSAYEFANNKFVTSLCIPTSITGFAANTFTGTTNLSKIHYMGTVDQWASMTFGTSATSGTGTANPFYAGKGSLYVNGDELVTSAVINVDVSAYAFAYCGSLTSVTIGAGVTKINNYAFMYCYQKVEVINLSSLTIALTDTSYSKNGGIGSNAKAVLTAAPETSNFIYDGDLVFYFDGTNYYLVNYTGYDVFVTLPKDINGNEYVVNAYAFYNMPDLLGIAVLADGQEFANNAVNACTGLKYLMLGEGVSSVTIGSTNTNLKAAAQLPYDEEGAEGTWNYLNGRPVPVHACVNSEVVISYPTCVYDGFVITVCSLCGDVKDEQVIYAFGHTVVDWYIVYEGTCIVDNIEEGVCITCGAIQTRNTKGNHKADQNGNCVYCGNALYDELAYELNGEEYTVTGLKYDYTTIVFIPATYNGKPVTAMADNIFKNNKTIKEVYIGNNVTTISTAAFSGCSALTKITIGTGVKEIKATAFSSTSALKEVHYAGTIDQYAQIVFGASATSGTGTAVPFYAGYGSLFIDGKKVTNAVITANVNSYAFYHVSGIITLDISSETIGTYAFGYCCDLVQVILREGLTSIGKSAFMYCYKKAEIINLSSLTIALTDDTAAKNGGIGSNGKVLLDAIPETSNLIITEDGNVFYNDGGEYLFMAFIGEGVCVLPEKINGNAYTVAAYAFYYNKFITSLYIPTAITAFAENTFTGTTNLSEIHYMGTVDQWASMVFGTSAESGKATAVPFYAGKGGLYVNGDELVTSAVINVDVSAYAFAYCGSLTSVTIGAGVTKINNYAFMYCYKKVEVINLSGLTIALTDTTYSKNGGIGSNAKVVLTAVPETSNLIYDGDFVFYFDGTDYYLVNYLGDDEIVTLPKDVNGNDYVVNGYAFYNKHNLVAIIVTADGQEFANNAVNTCAGLKYLFLAEGVESVTIGTTNANLKAATQIAYSEEKVVGNWHYVDGVPAIWTDEE